MSRLLFCTFALWSLAAIASEPVWPGKAWERVPAAARYGPIDWDPQTNKVTPYADALGLLNPLEKMEQEIALAMRRAQEKEITA